MNRHLRVAVDSVRYRSLRSAHTVNAKLKGRLTVDNLGDLDRRLDEAEAAFERSHGEGMAVLNGLRYAPLSDLPDDPAGAEYRERQLDLYCHLSGRDGYTTASEVSGLDAEAEPAGLYPYSTRNSRAVGEQLQAIGFAIETMELPEGAKVVEFGPGWGHLTVQLALTGYAVTAVDINPQMAEVIGRQAKRHGVEIDVRIADMVEFRPESPVDAAVFFESFHHCFDFPRLLDNLGRHVAAGGLVALVAEPIAALPYPWGLRLDGLSLWSIRREGWCELGFSSSYFRHLVAEHGWAATHHKSAGSRLTDVWILKRS